MMLSESVHMMLLVTSDLEHAPGADTGGGGGWALH